jgi:hypothetical protein
LGGVELKAVGVGVQETTAVAVHTSLPNKVGGWAERAKNFKAWDAEELRVSQVKHTLETGPGVVVNCWWLWE